MPSRLTYPGVYVEEKSSGSRTITGVSTSTALFIGMSPLGPIGVPTPVRSFDQFEQKFGNNLTFGEMGPQVRQFFLNGGSEAIIARAANGAVSAAVTLQSESGTDDVLALTALDAGALGDEIRTQVDYDTITPELTFNLTLYRDVVDTNTGVVTQESIEEFGNLSMDPALSNYVETVVNGQSSLVSVIASNNVGAGDRGFSQSGLILDVAAADPAAINTIQGLMSATTNRIMLSVDGGAQVTVILPDPTGMTLNNWMSDAQANINAALVSANQNTTVAVTPPPFGTGRVVRIASGAGSTVLISTAPDQDAAAVLQLGSAQGGMEISAYSRFRPAPSGYVSRISTANSAVFTNNNNLSRLSNFAFATRANLDDFELVDAAVGSSFGPPGGVLVFSGAGTTFMQGDANGDGIGSLRNVAAHLDTLAASIRVAVGTAWDVARHGLRLVLTPNYGNANTATAAVLDGATSTFDIGAATQIAPANQAANTAAYSLGASGTTTRQTTGVAGLNGTAPQIGGSPPDDGDYDAIFTTVRQDEQLLFNLLLLPRGIGQTDANRALLWGTASAFCREQRAFLLIDPPSENGNWSDVDEATNGISSVRLGAVGDHAALYWPRVSIASGTSTIFVDPCGTVAGVMARTDVRRGVWKAPAGLDASTLGAVGLQYLVDDRGNGVTNPQAINTLRRFPAGAVVWGARTLAGFDNSGEDDYKYVPVRRLALFIEESLYQGLKFAVFEPNDKPLWDQIRVAAGSFMQNLFRQGAFQGQKTSDAYQVLCDETTTIQNDINLGRVNVVVKFAPLKPAEFVVLTIQQLAGQVQT